MFYKENEGDLLAPGKASLEEMMSHGNTGGL
jgi:hypothetical protein